MKRIVLLVCIALIGGLLYAGVGVVVTDPGHVHHESSIAASALPQLVVEHVQFGVQHHHESSTRQVNHRTTSIASPHHAANSQCPAVSNDCCQAAVIPPEQFSLPSPALSGIALSVMPNPPSGHDGHEIYKPPRA